MNWYYHNRYLRDIGELVGKTFSKIEATEDQMILTCEDGTVYTFDHDQSCCEKVRIEDIIGNLDDLVGAPLLMAEEETSEKDPPDWSAEDHEYNSDSFTWTFYKFATVKGYVTVRWLGESNGYYSETVELTTSSS